MNAESAAAPTSLPSQGSSSFNLAHDLVVVKPEKVAAFPIPVSDWEHVRGKVSKIEEPSFVLNTIGSALIGVAVSAIFTVIAFPESKDTRSLVVLVICWAIFAVALISGGVCLGFDFHSRKNFVSNSKKDVVEEMDRLKTRYGGAKP